MFADYTSAPIGEPLRSALGFVEKMTLTPDELTADDARAVYAAGVSDQISEAEHWVNTKFLLKFGYDLPGPLRLLGKLPNW